MPARRIAPPPHFVAFRPRSVALVCILLSLTLSPAAALAPRDLRLTFIGDIMGHDVNYRMKDYRDIYRGVESVFLSDDLTVANLELPMDFTRPEAGYPFFNGTTPYVRAAVEAGVDAFSLANNHAYDGGETGIFQTIRALQGLRGADGRPLLLSGVRGNPRRPFLPASKVVRGVRIGFLAATQFLNEPDSGRYVNVVDDADAEAVERFLALVRDASRRFDLLIVSYHGDREYIGEPSRLKRAFFHRLLEAGAHIVFSHHPHVVQGFEAIRVNGSERLIMYSMGNFISGMTWWADPASLVDPLAATGEGYMLSVSVRCTDMACAVRRVEPIPIANYRNARGEMAVALMRDLASRTVPVGAAWRAYYSARLARMEGWLGRFPLAAR
jgi:poly-gamma-glutamate synthesis protein (capsule biosynthesis protein)